MAAGHVIVVVAVALLGGAVLNAQALTDAAARQPFGWKRTAAVVAATPFRGVAGLLGLDRPHAVLASAAADATGGPAPASSESAEAAKPPEDVPVQPPPDDPVDAAAATEPAAPPSETDLTIRRATRRDPLKVWVGGDSLTSEFGPALADRLARTRRAGTEVEFHFSSGLARPDFFNWPARFGEIVKEQDPDAFVVMFGANDGQNIAAGGEVLAFGSPEWTREYTRRVAAVMDTLSGDGRQLLWVGQPIARSSDFDAKMQVLNGIYAAEAEGRDNVTYVDTRPLFASDGAYAAYLEDDDGQSVLMRQQDGIHLTRAGGERLAAVVLDLLDERWALTSRPPAP